MKATIKTVTASLTTLLLLLPLSSGAEVKEIPYGKKIQFIELETHRSSLDGNHDIIEVIGHTRYTNACKVKDYKFKTLETTGSQLKYSVFGSDGDSLGCPKIYLPVEESYVIDRIKVTKDSSLKISVNGITVD